MRVKHIIKWFEFKNDERRLITLGSGTRLHPDLNRLQLLADSDGLYPTTLDLFASHRVTSPQSLKKWVGFQADLANKKDDSNTVVTKVLFRLSDGTTERYWNSGASAWVAAAPNNWNTEQEVADNIDKFPIPVSKSLQVIVNPSTEDPLFTPEIKAIRVLYESDFEEMEDYLVRSLIPRLRENVRPIGEHAVVDDAAPIATIDLTNDVGNPFRIETPYNIVDVDSVYDLTADPGKLNDLLASFDIGTNIATLATPVPVGNTALIRFLYAPPVAWTTSQDYIEVEKVPNITILNVLQEASAETIGKDAVINKGTGAGKQIEPDMADITMQIEWMAASAKDNNRMGDMLKRHLVNSPLLRSVGLDEDFRLWLLDEFDDQTLPSQQELHAGRLRLRIVKALFYDREAVDVTGVLNFGLTLGQATTC